MSTIIKCDRCGKELSSNDRIPRTFKNVRLIESRFMFSIFDSHRYERDIDLCNECDNSFIDWFNSGNGSRKLKKYGDIGDIVK